MIKEFPKVGIVVVNYNGLEYSNECIKSLLEIDYPNYTIIFIDNGSTDGSGEAIRKQFENRIVYLTLPNNLGVTGGNNLGIDYALENNFDYILFLNNDTTVEKTFLSKMVRSSTPDGQALIVPKIICYYDQKRLDHWIGPEFNWWTAKPRGFKIYPYDHSNLNIKISIKVASTCCLLVPRQLINNIGKMDEKYFMYLDDADFTIRAVRAGYQMIYEPEAIIYHKCNMTTRNKQSSFFQHYLISRNYFYFYQKLCRNNFIKYYFLTKQITLLFLHLLKAFITGDSIKRKVDYVIFKDIFSGKMGAPPNFNKI